MGAIVERLLVHALQCAISGLRGLTPSIRQRTHRLREAENDAFEQYAQRLEFNETYSRNVSEESKFNTFDA